MARHPSYPELAPLMKAGALAADEQIFTIVRDFLENRSRIAELLANGSREEAMRTVYDGMPRTLGQKKGFDALLDETGREPAWAIKLHLDDDPKVADEIARASVRYRAKRDAARGKPRLDDEDTAAVERRIRAFHDQTEPLFERYGEDGRLLIVDAKPTFDYDTLATDDEETFDRSAEEVYARLINAINNR